MKWTEKFRITSYDTDLDKNLRPTAILRYYTETALRHIDGCHPSADELRETGRAFVVCRTACDYLVPIKENDEITVSTWAPPSSGFSFERNCTFYRGDELCIKIVSQWALLNFEKGSLCRVTDEFAKYGSDDPIKTEFPVTFRLPRDIAFEKVASHTVGYPDTDVNQHMNNAMYGDMLMDYTDYHGKRADHFTIAYYKEAHIGSSFDIMRARREEDGSYLFRTVKDDGQIGIEAIIHLV